MREPVPMHPDSHLLVVSVCYVRLAASELHASARFAADILGLQRVAESGGEIAFRSDNRFRTLSFGNGGSGYSSIGIEIWDERALDEIEKRLGKSGFASSRASAGDCQLRYVQAALLARDGSGNNIDLVARPTQSGRRYFPSRDAGITRFHGVGMRSTDLARDLQFWKELGAEVSDWVGDIAYLRIDGLHHRIALYPAKRPGLLYAAFEAETLDSIMQNSYFMQERQIRIVQGPGREPCSKQIFLHVEGPDGVIFSYVNGMSEIGPGPRPPRQFARVPESLCAWGSEAKGVAELGASVS
jgi:2,3-dihydroxy-p-cumate/2,3-dihydroxybenzoate 3,4-dioxygenase